MNQEHAVKIYKKLKFQNPSLVVVWNEDAGNLGRAVGGYLKQKLTGQEFAEITLENFFPLDGVSVKDDLAQFPESKFYACQENKLVIFQSTPPESEWYAFLNSVLDMAEHHCQIKELYTIGGMISESAHTIPRTLLTIVNSPEMKETLSQYDIASDMDYQTPHGQRPTLSSFLLWVAKRRNIQGASLWVPIPFYLVATEDIKAQRSILSFLDKRFELRLDFSDLDQEVQDQNEKLAQLRFDFPKIDDPIRRLESNLGLSEEENRELIRQIEKFLSKRR